jgi:hypothetical protein
MLLHVFLRGLTWIDVHSWWDHILLKLIKPTDEAAATSPALHLVDPRVRLAFLGLVLLSSLFLEHGVFALDAMVHCGDTRLTRIRSSGPGCGGMVLSCRCGALIMLWHHWRPGDGVVLRLLLRVTALVTLTALESIKNWVIFGWPYGS